ncbi:MFS transporter [Psychromicrobium xiongbiense]|uniref:MFS transporter n=1 Tax=Psychromicrobium xiongbiense TaxID=3051184 RepID=UPI0025568A58|nr:MFS transporter [Psychromicrobium sp. YIM S02556]
MTGIDASPTPQHGGRFSQLAGLSGKAFFPIGLFARLPLAMLTVGVLTLLTEVSGSYAIGGFAAGAVGIGSAMGAPVLGFLADRMGQKPVLVTAALLNAAMVALLLILAYSTAAVPGGQSAISQAPVGVLIVAWLGGVSSPQVGPLARVRWMAMARKVAPNQRDRVLDTALSYESTADEVTFVLGPALVGLLASLIAPWLPLALAGALTVALVIVFALHPSVNAITMQRGGTTTPTLPGVPHERLLWLKVAVPVLGMVCMGTFFGGTQTALSAFAGQVAAGSGGAGLAGLLYSLVGLSSAFVALSVAFWPSRFAPRWRWVACAALMAGLAWFLLIPQSLPPMIAVLLVLGIPVGPTMVTIFTIGGLVAPRRWLGTVMTALASGIVAGTALGASLAGSLAQSHGYREAFFVPVLAAGTLLLLGLVTALLVRRPVTRP